MAAIEVLLHPSFYDSCSDNYYEPYRADNGLVLGTYASFVCDIVKAGSYADMHVVLALSSVVHKPIQTQWPIVARDAWSSPLTNLVYGRDVQTDNPINILWTIGSAKYPGKNGKLNINHFVPLIALSSATGHSSESLTSDQGTTDGGHLEEHADSSSDEEEQLCPIAHGEPLQNSFLSLKECVEYLCNDTPGVDHIPNGVKENKWFKVYVAIIHISQLYAIFHTIAYVCAA